MRTPHFIAGLAIPALLVAIFAALTCQSASREVDGKGLQPGDGLGDSLEDRADSSKTATQAMRSAPESLLAPPMEIEVAETARPGDARLCFKVLDDARRTVSGIPVRLLVLPAPISDSIKPLEMLLEPTGSNGLTGISRAEVREKLNEAGENATLYAELNLPLGRQTRERLGVGLLPPGPIELVLPPSGSVLLEVRDDLGRPADGGSVVLGEVRRDPEAFVFTRAVKPFRCPITSGRAVFPVIGLDLELEARAEDGRRVPLSASKRLHGPTLPGEQVCITLELDPPAPELTARLVDAAAGPIRMAKVELLLILLSDSEPRLFGDGQGRQVELLTDDDGRVHHRLEERFAGARQVRMRFAQAACPDGRRTAQVDLRPPFPRGRLDCGEVVLERAPRVAAGVVVDARGRPLPGARLHALCKYTDRKAPAWKEGRVSLFIDTMSDGEGRFELREDREIHTIQRLEFAHPDFCSRRLRDVEPGRMDLRIVLERAGTIVGSLKQREGLEPARVQVAWNRTGSKPAQFAMARDTTARVHRDGTFRIESMAPGSYDLRFCVHRVQVLHVVSGVEVAAGEETRDPRLHDIDLLGDKRVLQLALEDESGEALRRAVVSVRSLDAGESDEEFQVLTESGWIDLAVPSEAARFLVGTDGRRPAEVAWSSLRRTVILRQGLEVELDLMGDPSAPPVVVGAQLRLSPLDGTSEVRGTLARRDSCGRILCFVPQPGRYQIEWHVIKTSGMSFSSARVASQASSVVEVQELPGRQSCRVAIPEEVARFVANAAR